MARALDGLAGDAIVPAVAAHNATGAAKASIDIGLAALDLQLAHLPPAEIDRARFELWAHQVVVDSRGDDPGTVAGDASTLEWVWDRIAHTYDQAEVGQIERQLVRLRSAADDENLAAAARAAERLLASLGTRQPSTLLEQRPYSEPAT
jgi:hypothetical protein